MIKVNKINIFFKECVLKNRIRCGIYYTLNQIELLFY